MIIIFSLLKDISLVQPRMPILRKERLRKSAYLNKNIGSLSPEKVLDLYNRTIDDKVFQTPIG